MTAEEIKNNWDRLMELIDTEFSGERKKQLTDLYTHFEERISVMPASSFEHFHNCFPGGYVDHILRVCECASELYELWNRMGC